MNIIKDRFVLEAAVAETRFLSIYRAVDNVPGPDGRHSRVLLWIFEPSISENSDVLAAIRSRFARLVSLSHPNVVSLYELTHDGDRFFVIGEYLEAETLQNVLDNLEPEQLDHSEVDEILTSIGSGLAYAHERGVTHGDVRAENVLVTTDAEIKLANFMTVPHGPGAYSVSAYEDVHDLAALAFELYTGAPYRDHSVGRMEEIPVERRAAVEAVLTHPSAGYGPATVREFMTRAGLRDLRRDGSAQSLPSEPAIAAPQRLEYVAATRQGRGWPWASSMLALIVAVGAVYWRDPLLSQLRAATTALGLRQPVSTAPANARETLATSAIVSRPESPATGRPDPGEAADGQAPNAAVPANVARDTASPNELVPQDTTSTPARRPAVSLVTSTQTASESQGMITVQVRLVGEPEGTVEIAWWTSDGTAIAGDDYANFERRVEQMSAERSTLDLHIPLTSDVIDEPQEHFYVHIEAASDGVDSGEITRAEVTLIDDDSRG